MRISKSSPSRITPLPTQRWLVVSLWVLAFVFGFVAADQGWFSPLFSFLAQVKRNPAQVVSSLVTPSRVPTLTLDVDFEGYQQLVAQHQAAVANGAYLTDDTQRVPATAHFEAATVPVTLQLLEGDAARLDGERWPLALVVADGMELANGMTRMALAPVTADTALLQGYLEHLRHEGFAAITYRWVQMRMNGRDLGLYLLQADPDPETVVSGGVLVSFDPADYWAAQPYDSSGFAYAAVAIARIPDLSRAEGVAALRADPALAALQTALVVKFRMLATGELSPAQVFDPEQMGRFLAITMFWYGDASLDWRTLRLVYAPQTGLLAPVGVMAPVDKAHALPAFFMDDPAVQRAMVQTMTALADPATLDALRAELGDDFALFTHEPDYGVAPWAVLAEHQAMLLRRLTPTLTLSVEVTESPGKVCLWLNTRVPYPVEVLALDLGEQAVVSVDPAWLMPGGAVVPSDDAVVLAARVDDRPRGATLCVPLSAMPVPLPGTAGDLQVVTRLWGGAVPVRVPARTASPDGLGLP